MNSFFLRRGARPLVLLCCLGAIACAPAQARDRGARQPTQRAGDFYAVAQTSAEAPQAHEGGHNCFMTSSPMEATKGIRHWTGRC